MTEHARLGPSDSARWLTCPGSISFTKDYPNSSSAAADEGTVAHWVREQCLYWGDDPYDYIGHQMTLNGTTWTVDSDMADALMEGIDFIREFSGKMFIEDRIDLGRWMPGQFGTLDLGIASKDVILISDLKFGRGVAVDPVRNTQQMIYALGFWDQHARHVTKAEKVLIHIDQPRHARGGGIWTTTVTELLAFGEELKRKAAATLDPDAPLIPSEKGCLWCPAANIPGRAGGCPAHAKSVLDAIDLDFDSLDEPEKWEPPLVAGLTPERLLILSEKKKQIEGFLEYAHAMALQYLVDHGPTADKKAVVGRRPPMKWADDGAAEAFLLQKSVDPFNKRLITPRQAASQIGKKYELPAALVERGEGKPVIVDIGDARPAIQTVENEFDDMDDL